MTRIVRVAAYVFTTALCAALFLGTRSGSYADHDGLFWRSEVALADVRRVWPAGTEGLPFGYYPGSRRE